MNFLAHLYLSEPDPRALIGNILPDLVRVPGRGRVPAGLDPVVLEGVQNHRRVDAFTDTHPLFARSRARLSPRHGRFSGILVDMLYDHFLARDWPRHHPQPLPQFSRHVHDVLDRHRHAMPPAMSEIVDVMARQDWLCSYATTRGLEVALRRMSRRFSQRFGREIRLETVIDDLPALDDALYEDFTAFFPELVRYVRPAPAALM